MKDTRAPRPRKPLRAIAQRATCIGSVGNSEVILVLDHNRERLQRRHLRDRHLVTGLELRIADVADISQVRLRVTEIVEVEREFLLLVSYPEACIGERVRCAAAEQSVAVRRE